MTLTIQSQLVQAQHTLNDIKLHIVKSGDPDGEPVILLHGYPDFWFGWRHQIDFLTDLGFRLYIPDQRGYNRSQKVQGGINQYHLDHLARDVIALIDHIGVERIKLVAHDWGALVAWWTALNYPDRIEKLVVMCAPHPKIFREALKGNIRQILRSWYAWIFQIPYLPEKVLSLRNYEIAVETLRTSGRKNTFSRAQLEIYREAYAQPEALTSALNYYRAFIQKPLHPPSSWSLHQPVMLIWGGSDRYLEPSLAEDSLKFCTNGQLHFVDASHWVQVDATDAVNQHLKDFLT